MRSTIQPLRHCTCTTASSRCELPPFPLLLVARQIKALRAAALAAAWAPVARLSTSNRLPVTDQDLSNWSHFADDKFKFISNRSKDHRDWRRWLGHFTFGKNLVIEAQERLFVHSISGLVF